MFNMAHFYQPAVLDDNLGGDLGDRGSDHKQWIYSTGVTKVSTFEYTVFEPICIQWMDTHGCCKLFPPTDFHSYSLHGTWVQESRLHVRYLILHFIAPASPPTTEPYESMSIITSPVLCSDDIAGPQIGKADLRTSPYT